MIPAYSLAERTKIERMLKKLNKSLAATEDPTEKEKLEKDIHIAEVDLNYALYFPLNEPYISVHPKTGPRADRPLADPSPPTSIRPPMWAEIEKRMELSTYALEQLRDGPTTTLSFRPKPRPRPAKARAGPALEKKQLEPHAAMDLDPTLNRRERRRAMGISQKTDNRFDDGSLANGMGVDADGDDNMSDGGFFEE